MKMIGDWAPISSALYSAPNRPVSKEKQIQLKGKKGGNKAEYLVLIAKDEGVDPVSYPLTMRVQLFMTRA